MKPVRLLLGTGVTYAIATGVSSTGTLVMVLLAARFLESAQYGALALLLVILEVGRILCRLGVGSGVFIAYMAATSASVKTRIFASGFWILTAAGVVVAASWIVLAPTVSDAVLGGSLQLGAAHVLALAFLLDAAMTLGLSFLRVTQRAGLYLVLSVVKTSAMIGGALVLLLVTSLEARLFVIAEVGSVALVSLVALVMLRNELRVSPSRDALHHVLSPSLPLLLTAISGWAVAWSDRLLLANFVPLSQIGEYELASRVASIFNVAIVAPFSLVWARSMFDVVAVSDEREIVRHVFTAFVTVLTAAATILAILGQDIVELLGGRPLAASQYLVPVLVASNLCYALYYFWTFGPAIANNTVEYLGVTAVAGGVNVGLNLLVLPHFGIFGAAYTTLVAYASMALLMWWRCGRYRRVRYDWRRVGLSLGICTGLVLTVSRLSGPLALVAKVAIVVSSMVWVFVVVKSLLDLETTFRAPAVEQAGS